MQQSQICRSEHASEFVVCCEQNKTNIKDSTRKKICTSHFNKVDGQERKKEKLNTLNL
jgi:hypothetical protein